MATCSELDLFEVALTASDPALGPLVDLLNAPDSSTIKSPFCPGRCHEQAGAQHDRILTMVAFAASCVGLLLFLWISFGGAVPFAAQGYRLKAEFSQAVQLGSQSDVRISGVSVGKVVSVSLDRRTGLTRAVMQIDPAVTRPARRHARHPARRRHCSARPTSS